MVVCACMCAPACLQMFEYMRQNHKLTSTVSVTGKATNKTMGVFKLMLFKPQHDPHIIYMFLPRQSDLNFLHRIMTNQYMHKKKHRCNTCMKLWTCMQVCKIQI